MNSHFFSYALDKDFHLIIPILFVVVVFIALGFSYFKTADIFLMRFLMLILMINLASIIRIIYYLIKDVGTLTKIWWYIIDSSGRRLYWILKWCDLRAIELFFHDAWVVLVVLKWGILALWVKPLIIFIDPQFPHSLYSSTMVFQFIPKEFVLRVIIILIERSWLSSFWMNWMNLLLDTLPYAPWIVNL